MERFSLCDAHALGKLAEGHLAFCHHNIKIYGYHFTFLCQMVKSFSSLSAEASSKAFLTILRHSPTKKAIKATAAEMINFGVRAANRNAAIMQPHETARRRATFAGGEHFSAAQLPAEG